MHRLRFEPFGSLKTVTLGVRDCKPADTLVVAEVRACVCVYVCVRARAHACACVRVCARACSVHVCVCVRDMEGGLVHMCGALHARAPSRGHSGAVSPTNRYPCHN